MEARIARFSELRPIALQQDATIPQAALDIIYARQLLPVIGREDGVATALASAAPINGAGGITITLAVCPSGQGPDLHLHKATFETFTVLQGRFEFRWGEAGEDAVQLDRFDAISVPPGFHRRFRNISDETGILQVLISGGVHDSRDVEIPKAVSEAIQGASNALHSKMAASGITFLES
jgi:uncharacterized RmlC-like cupin family protein